MCRIQHSFCYNQILSFFFFLLTFTPAETCQQLLLASSNPTREDLNVPQYPFPPLFHGIRQQKQSQTNSSSDNRGKGWAGSSSSHHWPALLPELQRCTKPQHKHRSSSHPEVTAACPWRKWSEGHTDIVSPLGSARWYVERLRGI